MDVKLELRLQRVMLGYYLPPIVQYGGLQAGRAFLTHTAKTMFNNTYPWTTDHFTD